MHRYLTLILLTFLSIGFLTGQSNDFSDFRQPPKLLKLEAEKISNWLQNAPLEFTPAAKNKLIVISLPDPAGQYADYRAELSPIASDKLAAKYPEFNTYRLFDLNTGAYAGRLLSTPLGIDAVVKTETGMVCIEPHLNNTDLHRVYYTKDGPPIEHPIQDMVGEKGFTHQHGTDEPEHEHDVIELNFAKTLSIGTQMRNIDTKIVVSGTYSDKVTTDRGITKNNANVTAAIMASINNISAIYESEAAVKLIMLTPFIYLDPNNDPFPVNGLGLADEASKVFSDLINAGEFSVNSFDLGHVFKGDGGGGSAYVGVICDNNTYDRDNFTNIGPYKAGGGTGTSNPVGSGWWGLVAHEMGHQFSCRHTFNGDESNCGSAGQYSADNAYEPGSGSTIMSYNGICGTQNIGGGENYFHINSIEAINNHLNDANGGAVCKTDVATGNNPPTSNANPGNANNYQIPVNTPFEVTGSASDPDGNALTYCWEQYDRGTQGAPNIGANDAGAPLFRSFPPTSSPTRTFPQINDILTGTSTIGEILPNIARDINLRLTVRDGAGGVACSNITLKSQSGSPFDVNAPSGNPTWNADNATDYTVSWSTGGSEAYCANVDILLSTDGGLTFPYTLASGVANSAGTAMVKVPTIAPNTTQARIKVACASNDFVRFFDISADDFTISSNCTADGGYLCPTSAVNADQGDAALNLNVSQFGGVPIASLPNVQVSSSDNDGRLPWTVGQSNTDNTCSDTGSNRNMKRIKFKVTTTGEYTFSIPGFVTMSLYNTPINSANICDSYIAANTYQLGNNQYGQTDGSMTATLSSCTEYEIVVYSVFGDVDAKLSGSGPGNIIVNGAAATGTYNYLLVRNSDNIIQSVLSSADLTSESAGAYTLYGINVTSGSLSSLANTNFDDIYTTLSNQGICANLSQTNVPVNITGNDDVLPISILGLYVAKQGNAVALHWETEGIEQGATFRVLRSADSQDFTTLGTVTTKDNNDAIYQWTDNKPSQGLNYYRIELVGTDGRVLNSNIVSVHFTGGDSAIVYPNPTHTDQFRLDYVSAGSRNVDIIVENSQGQQLNRYKLESIAGLNRYDLTLDSNTPPGIYIIRLRTAGQTEQILRVVRM